MQSKIEHVALWASDLERMRSFYVTYFGAVASEKYTNPSKAFESYFLTFPSGGARLEVMRMPGQTQAILDGPCMGRFHIAFALGSESAVDHLTARLRADGYAVVNGPRRTGDGYYESVILDPEGNRIELTV
ncbi:MAG: VOC family protein [Bacillota bacterium]